MAKCPEEIIVATFLYLERLSNLNGDEKKIILNEGDAEEISTKILNVLQKRTQDIEKSELAEKIFSSKTPSFTLSAKSNLDAVNFIESDKNRLKIIHERSDKYEIQTPHDVDITTEVLDVSEQDDKIGKEIFDIEANKIILENEDSIGYSTQSIEATAYNIGKKIADILGFDKSEMIGTAGVLEIANNFISTFSKYNYTPMIKSNDQMANILHFEFSPSSIAEFREFLEKDYSTIDISYLENWIDEIKDELNMNTKRNLLDIIFSRTENMKHFEYTFLEKIDVENNNDLYNEIKDAKKNKLQISFSSSQVINPIYTIKTRNDNRKVYLKIDSKYKYLDDSLIKEKLDAIVPAKTIFSMDESKINVYFDYTDNEEDVKLLRASSQQATKDYFYHSSFVDSYKNSVLSVDESDNGAKGNKAKILRKISENCENVILATGTFLDGYPKNIAYQMAYLDGIKDVEGFARQLTEEFGVFSLKNNAIKNLVYSVMTNTEVSNMFYDAIKQFQNAKKNEYKISSAFTKDFITYISDNGLIQGEIDFMKAVNTFSFVLKASVDYLKGSNNGLDILKKVIFDSRKKSNPLVKEEAGLQSVFSFVQLLKSQKGGHINIATRELLHNVKENIVYPDLKAHNQTKSDILSDNIGFDMLSENNNVFALVTDLYFDYYARDNHITSIKYLLQTNFEYFIESASGMDSQSKANLEIIKPPEMTREEFLGLVSSTKAKTSDSIIEDYKLYIKNNGVLPEIENKDKEKLLLHLLKQFQTHFLDVVLKKRESEFVMKKFVFPEKLANSFGEMFIENELQFKDSYPYKKDTQEHLMFSHKVGFHKEEWKEFLEEPIEYTYTIGSDNNREIMNVFSSKGREKEIHKNIQNGENFVVGSARTLSTAFNVCDAIAGAIKRENKDKPILIQVVQSSDLKRILSKVNTSKLENEYNIKIQIEPSSLISSEVNKAEARGIHSPLFTNIDAAARGLDLSSKGVVKIKENGDKVMHGKLYTTGTTVSSGNLLQFFSRTFKPKVSDSADISVYCGGGNMDLMVEKKGDIGEIMDKIKSELVYCMQDDAIVISDKNKAMEDLAFECVNDEGVGVCSTFNDKLGERALESLTVSKEFMSGKRSDKAVTNINDVISISDAYQAQLYDRGIAVESTQDIAV